jgi:hypothetical protein
MLCMRDRAEPGGTGRDGIGMETVVAVIVVTRLRLANATRAFPPPVTQG